jgi:hypothetical protein
VPLDVSGLSATLEYSHGYQRHAETVMGNPAMVKRKKTERRRKKYEQRLGPGVYLPKEERLKFNAEVENAAKAALKEKAERAKAKKEKKSEAREKPAPEKAPTPPAKK